MDALENGDQVRMVGRWRALRLQGSERRRPRPRSNTPVGSAPVPPEPSLCSGFTAQAAHLSGD